MAEVYLATDRVLDRPVAVKVLGSWLATRRAPSSSGSGGRRCRRRGSPTRNLVAVFDAGSEERRPLHRDGARSRARRSPDVLRREGRLAAGPSDERSRLERRRCARGGARRRDRAPRRQAGERDAHAGRPHQADGPRDRPGHRRGEHHARLVDPGHGRLCLARAGSGRTGRPSLATSTRSAASSTRCSRAASRSRPTIRSRSPTSTSTSAGAPDVARAVHPARARGGDVLRAMEKDPAARFPSAADMASALDDATAPVPPVDATRPLPCAATPLPPLPRPHDDPLPRRADRPPPSPPDGPPARRRRRARPPRRPRVRAVRRRPSGGRPRPTVAEPLGVSFAVASPSPSPSPSPTAASRGLRSRQPSRRCRASWRRGRERRHHLRQAAEEIQKGLDEALEKFAEGDTEKAIEELEHLRGEVDELVDHDEIRHSQEQRMDRAIEDLAEQMFLASPSEDD